MLVVMHFYHNYIYLFLHVHNQNACTTNDDCSAAAVCATFTHEGSTTTSQLCAWSVDFDDLGMVR